MDSISGISNRAMLLRLPESDNLLFSRDNISIHYGTQGKRQAVLYFMVEVASRERAQTLLLYSDEETSWMTGDPTFAQNLEALMLCVLAQGNRVKIIHDVSRNISYGFIEPTTWKRGILPLKI